MAIRLKIVMTRVIPDSWINQDEIAEMDDEEILEIFLEDIPELIDDATWELIREEVAE